MLRNSFDNKSNLSSRETLFSIANVDCKVSIHLVLDDTQDGASSGVKLLGILQFLKGLGVGVQFVGTSIYHSALFSIFFGFYSLY